MTEERFRVVAGAGELRSLHPDAVHLPHRWTSSGITVDAAMTGAHLLHLSVAACVLNDVYREAERMGIAVRGVRVEAEGGFDDTWRSTGVRYAVDVQSDAEPERLEALLAAVDEVAEIPKALRTGVPVHRTR